MGGYQWAKRALLISFSEVASGKLGNLDVTLPITNFFAIHIVGGVVSVMKDFQYWALAAFIALKYRALNSRAVALS